MDDAEDAIKSSKLLFEQGLYGNSAFHAQQCVEMSIKAYLLKFHPTIGNFNSHLPLELVLTKLKPEIKILGPRVTNPIIEKLLEKAGSALDDISKKADSAQKVTHRKNLWECSMGLSKLNQKDFKIVQEFQNIKKDHFENEILVLVTGSIRKLLPKIKRSEKENLKRHFLSMPIKDVADDDINDEIIEIAFSEDSEESIQNRICALVDTIKNSKKNLLGLLFEAQDLFKDITKHKQTENMEILTQRELQAIFHMIYVIQHVEISLLTFPHEILGRYSDYIGDRPIKDLYRENKNCLQKLIKKSKDVFEQTDSAIKQYEGLHDMTVPNE